MHAEGKPEPKSKPAESKAPEKKEEKKEDGKKEEKGGAVAKVALQKECFEIKMLQAHKHGPLSKISLRPSEFVFFLV